MKILQRYLTWQKFILLCEDQGFFFSSPYQCNRILRRVFTILLFQSNLYKK